MLSRPFLPLLALLPTLGAGSHVENVSLVVPPAAPSALPRSVAPVGGTHIVIATQDGSVFSTDLRSGARAPLVLPLPVWAVAAAGRQEFWAVSSNGETLLRATLSGEILARFPLSPRAWAVAETRGGLVAARLAIDRESPLLWRGDPGSLAPWTLAPLQLSLSERNRGVANLVALASDGDTVAVVRNFFRPELVLVSPQGEVRSVGLPYFGETWAPLIGPADRDPVTWPKTYSSVVIAGERVWCLSFQEGPMIAPGDFKRGRHIVEVDLSGGVVGQHELPFDGHKLVSDDGVRMLIVDGAMGIWQFRSTNSEAKE